MNDTSRDCTAVKRRLSAERRIASEPADAEDRDLPKESLLHELRVHQIELEMQNAELLAVRDQLEQALGQYSELYDFAPVGYLTVSRGGIISTINLRGAILLGSERSRLVGRPFGRYLTAATRHILSASLEDAWAGPGIIACEVELNRVGTLPLAVQIQAVADHPGDGCRVVMMDISESRQTLEALRTSEERLRRVARAGRIGLYEWNASSETPFWSPEAYELFGHAPGAPVSYAAWLACVHPDDRQRVTGNLAEALERTRNRKQADVRLDEYRVRHRDGTVLHLEATTTINLEGGDLMVRGVVRDVSERKRGEESLRQSEERYRRLFEMESDTVQMVDSETCRFIDFNGAALRMYGYSMEEYMRLRLSDLSAEPEKTFQSLQDEETLVPLRWHRKKDGTVFPVEIAGSFFEYHGRKVHVSAIRDISERVRSEERLCELNRQLRTLGEHLQNVQEQERMALARDFHDDIGQGLTLLKFDLEWIARRLPADCGETAERLREMRACIGQLTASVQRIAADLRPPMLDNIGLPAALEWQVNEFGKRTGLECFVILNDDIVLADRNAASAVMRIVQEALTNVARHARATEICVSLCRDGGNLQLEISDNGCGITAEQAASHKAYGMMSMQERARLCRGTLAISSSPGGGTTLNLTVPLQTGEGAA